jgi:hypothetical protein
MIDTRTQKFASLRRSVWPFFLVLIALTWVLADSIVGGTNTTAAFLLLGVVLIFIAATILNDWRSGLYLSIVWLLFEDLVRKYLGNNMYVYFAKDALIGLTYFSFFMAFRKGAVPRFRPPFLFPLGLFFLLACIQVFNPESPSVFYGFLGMKLYFYYMPVMFVGYALVRTEADIRKFLLLTLALGALISALGIAQGVLGFEFLNPRELAPDIQQLGQLERLTPVTHQVVRVPSAVFVSAGRYTWYLIMVWILAMGTLAYLFLSRSRRTMLWLLLFAVITVAVVGSGGRSTFVWVAASAFVLSAAFLRHAPWRWGLGHRLTTALRRSFTVAGIGLFLIVQFYPSAVGASWAFYSESLSPASPGSELQHRGWEYPLQNLLVPFESSRWAYGSGTGTGSFGAQYLQRILGVPPVEVGAEGGFASLILEMGILGLVLWLAWSGALLVSGTRLLRQLRGTPYYPVGSAMLWFMFLLLIPFNFYSQQYQNFVYNFYFWLLVGIFFRLPALVSSAAPARSAAYGPAPPARWSPMEVPR